MNALPPELKKKIHKRTIPIANSPFYKLLVLATVCSIFETETFTADHERVDDCLGIGICNLFNSMLHGYCFILVK